MPNRTAEDARLNPRKGDTSQHKNGKDLREVTNVNEDGRLCVILSRVGGRTANGRTMSVLEWADRADVWTFVPASV